MALNVEIGSSDRCCTTSRMSGYHFTLQPVWMIQRCRQTDPSQRQKQKHKHLRITSLFLPSTIKQLPKVHRLEKMSPNLGVLTNNKICSMFFCLAPHSSKTPSPPHRASHGTNAGAVERQRPCRQPRPCAKWRGAEHQIQFVPGESQNLNKPGEGSPEQTPNQTSR